MKALIWKEWRENLKWAVIGFIVIGLVWWSLLGHPPSPGSIMDVQQPLLALAAGVAAAFLGGMFHDTRTEKRALLLHRPLSRSRIFWAKALAGLSLYLLAAGVPFVMAVLWAATPGHLAAPFRWAMLLPFVADLLMGVAYYFAALLSVQREARWYASRGLGVVGVFLCSLLVYAVPAFWQALLISAVAIGLSATAAWGTFSHGGAYTPQPSPARVALGTLMLAGVLVAGLMTLGAVAALLPQLFAVPPRAAQEIDRRGRVVNLHYDERRLVSVTDAETGVPLEAPGGPEAYVTREFQAPMVYLGAHSGERGYRSSGSMLTWFYIYEPVPTTSWLYVRDEGRLLGYNLQTKRLIGSIGPDGFTPAGQPPGPPFQGPLVWHEVGGLNFLPFPTAIYTINAKREVRTLFTAPPGETIVSAYSWDDQTKKPLVYVLTDRAVHILDNADRKELCSLRLTNDLAEHWVIVARLDDDRYALWYRPKGAGELASELTLYDGAGQELRRSRVPPLPQPDIPWTRALFGLLTPPVVGLAMVLINQVIGHGPLAPPAIIAGYGMLMLLATAACCIACLRLARTFAFGPLATSGWALIGLAFGPAGLLLMLILQEWPARVRCPSCGRLRVVTRERCEHCGAVHAAPAADGTEIFAATITIAAVPS